jgi:hypothetical protein
VVLVSVPSSAHPAGEGVKSMRTGSLQWHNLLLKIVKVFKKSKPTRTHTHTHTQNGDLTNLSLRQHTYVFGFMIMEAGRSSEHYSLSVSSLEDQILTTTVRVWFECHLGLQHWLWTRQSRCHDSILHSTCTDDNGYPSTQKTPCVGNPPGKTSAIPVLVLAAQG